MKKIITLCLFVFALFLGTQSAVAQNSNLEVKKKTNTIVNAKAAKETKALRKIVGFEKVQMDDVYEVIREYTYHTYLIENPDLTQGKEPKKMATVNEELDNNMKSVLTEEQFKRFKNYHNN
ncbi:hypothetical protein HSX10_02235 [Winogradskyella undariae]|uniref:hypothetical protein n=1 Tax=Winogradskyella TaxID=286104 RepID=UPI00156A8555|nr:MULTISPECIES: hypothetical protein [Winogradskyella]NRR90381.1 hypothetical protein [Winogradskyella undariae]QXP77781.1 hypothetical protein H0I32_11150 [Winogradskyella sp. HaHa_3_26]